MENKKNFWQQTTVHCKLRSVMSIYKLLFLEFNYFCIVTEWLYVTRTKARPTTRLAVHIACQIIFAPVTSFFPHIATISRQNLATYSQVPVKNWQPSLNLPRISVCNMWETSNSDALLLVNRCEFTMLRSLYCTGRRNPPKFTIFPPFSRWKSRRAVPSAFTSPENVLFRAGTLSFLRTFNENIPSLFRSHWPWLRYRFVASF